jgi:hypothetical protein
MKSRLLDVAIAVVRAWTRVYTWQLPSALRESRRAEIESDLWESRLDTGRSVSTAMQVTMRLLLGIPDDLQWRVEHASFGRHFKLTIAVLTTIVFLLAGLWVDLARARKLPVPFPPAPPLLLPVPSATPRPFP